MFKITPIALALTTAITTSQSHASGAVDQSVQEVQSIERIAVTGSLIARINTDTPSPVVSINAAAIKDTGILNMTDLLTQMPQFALGYNSGSGNSSFGNAGLSAVNLRNLGTDRTLTLVNGRRVVQSTYDNGEMVTDTGYIPTDLLERIDVLTGGAAATYGADAVAGVVNFVMKKDYEGTRISSQVGKSDIGDGNESSFTITTGHNFNNDKGNIVFSADYFDTKGASLIERPGSGEQTAWLNNPLNEGPDDDQPAKIAGYNLAWPDYNVQGQLMGLKNANGVTNYYDVSGDQAVYMYNSDDKRSPYYVQQDDNAQGYNINRYNKVQSPVERATLYSLFNYELSDTLHLTADIRYTKTTSQNQISPEFNYWLKGKPGYYSEDLVLPEYINDMLETTDGVFYSSIGLDELGPRTSDVDRELFAFSSTLSGEFSNGWVWDVYASTGKTSHNTLLSNRANKLRFNSGSDSITNDKGQYCGVDVFDCPASHPLLRMSEEALDYIRLDPYGSQITSKQHMFSATSSGDLIELPAGDLMFAAGIEFRRESLDMQVDDIWQEDTYTGNFKTPWSAAKTVQEGFIELEAPIITDVFLIDELILSAAGRMSDYTYAGTHNTWKLGATWNIIDGLAMRSTYARTIRAPQLNEQFTGQSIAFSGGNEDPCDSIEINNASAETQSQIISNCQAWGIEDPQNWTADTVLNSGVDKLTRGNTNLKPEKADTLTLGLVYSPSFIDNLSLTLDYYDIDLTDAMGSASIQSVMDKCARAEDINESIYCPLVERSTDGNIISVSSTTVNQASRRREGIDLELSYLQELQSFGQIKFTLNATKLLQSTYQNSADSDEVEITGIYQGNTELKTRFVIAYNYEKLRLNWTTNYAEGFQVDENGTYDLYDKPFAPHSIMHDARVSYDLNDDTNLYLGISNVFDKSYFVHPSTSYGRAQYDSMGRYFFGGFSYNF